MTYHIILADNLVAHEETALCGQELVYDFASDETIPSEHDWTTLGEYLKDTTDPDNCKECVAAIPPLLLLKHTKL